MANQSVGSSCQRRHWRPARAEYADLILTHPSSYNMSSLQAFCRPAFRPIMLWIFMVGYQHTPFPLLISEQLLTSVIASKEAIMVWLFILLRTVAGWNHNEACLALSKWGFVILTLQVPHLALHQYHLGYHIQLGCDLRCTYLEVQIGILIWVSIPGEEVAWLLGQIWGWLVILGA